MKRIVIATDGSHAAEEAVETGLELAEEQVAQVWLVHVQPRVELVVGTYFSPAVAVPPEHRLTSEEDEVLQRGAALAAERGIEATLVERLGYSAADEIGAVADEVDADLIVIGSRGMGALGRVVLGSTSREMLAKTHRPVLVVRATKVPAEA
jgi:nucleotide-binding universal stress UspA family protein